MASVAQNSSRANESYKKKPPKGINERLYNDAIKRNQRKKIIEETVFSPITSYRA